MLIKYLRVQNCPGFFYPIIVISLQNCCFGARPKKDVKQDGKLTNFQELRKRRPDSSIIHLTSVD